VAIDASIYGRFAQPPRSALDYAQGFTQLGAMQDQRQSAREQNALARLAAQQQMQAGEATQRRQNALQQLRQGLAGRPEAEVIEAMRSGGFFDEAGAAEKDYLGRQVLRADIGSKQSTGRKNEADAAKTETEAVGLALGQYQGLLAQVNNPQAARAWVQAQYRDPRVAPILAGFGPVEKALADIPDDPQAFGQWRDQAAVGIAKYQDMLAARQPKPAAPPASVAEYQFAKGEGYGGTYEQWVKDKARAGATNVNVGDKQLPAGAVKQQDEIIDRLATAKAIQRNMAAFTQQMDAGKLNFGPIRNLVNEGRNLAGASTEESRNFASFRSGLEKLRNDSLRLNTGVQTDGDAQRAWNELFQSINDPALVRQRLKEIEAINAEGARLQEYRLQVLRENFGARPLQPPPGASAPPPAAAAPAAPPAAKPSVSNW
jgi:hypothetical protein